MKGELIKPLTWLRFPLNSPLKPKFKSGRLAARRRRCRGQVKLCQPLDDIMAVQIVLNCPQPVSSRQKAAAMERRSTSHLV